MIRRRTAFGALAAVLLAFTGPARAAANHAGTLAVVDRLPSGGAIRVVDARPKRACERASLPGARCLPAEELFGADGRPVGFDALRWLLGTIGLRGNEQVLVVGATTEAAGAVGALLFLAGQRDVTILDHPPAIASGAPAGTARSLTSETIFTAPMRDRLLVAAPEAAPPSTIADGAPIKRLAVFARTYGGGAEPRPVRLWP